MLISKSMILLFLFGQYGGQAFTIGELTPILETLKTEIIAEFKSQLGEMEAKLTSHDGRISNIEEIIEKNEALLQLGPFAKCNKKWCLQSGLTKSQYTKCESVTNQGRTCNNPEIKYGSTTGGLPEPNSYTDYKKWCQQLGGTYSTHTIGTRTGYCLFWATGGDEPGAKWVDCKGFYWYNSSLDDHITSSKFITSVTCN